MKLTNLEMVTIFQNLNSFVEKDKVIPFKVSYAINKNLLTLQRELEPFEMTRTNILNKDISEDERKKEFEELLSIENEVDIRTVDLETISALDNLTTKEVMMFDFMITE